MNEKYYDEAARATISLRTGVHETPESISATGWRKAYSRHGTFVTVSVENIAIA
jgi:phage-related baseplate assembly protein